MDGPTQDEVRGWISELGFTAKEHGVDAPQVWGVEVSPEGGGDVTILVTASNNGYILIQYTGIVDTELANRLGKLAPDVRNAFALDLMIALIKLPLEVTLKGELWGRDEPGTLILGTRITSSEATRDSLYAGYKLVSNAAALVQLLFTRLLFKEGKL